MGHPRHPPSKYWLWGGGETTASKPVLQATPGKTASAQPCHRQLTIKESAPSSYLTKVSLGVLFHLRCWGHLISILFKLVGSATQVDWGRGVILSGFKPLWLFLFKPLETQKFSYWRLSSKNQFENLSVVSLTFIVNLIEKSEKTKLF